MNKTSTPEISTDTLVCKHCGHELTALQIKKLDAGENPGHKVNGYSTHKIAPMSYGEYTGATKSGAVKLLVLDPNEADAWAEVHKAGCQHLDRRGKWGVKRGTDGYEITVSTLLEAVEQIASDFIT